MTEIMALFGITEVHGKEGVLISQLVKSTYDNFALLGLSSFFKVHNGMSIFLCYRVLQIGEDECSLSNFSFFIHFCR